MVDNLGFQSTLADMVASLKRFPDKETRAASDILRRPSQNHIEGDWCGVVERFVISSDDRETIKSVFVAESDRLSAQALAKPPCVPCWIEVSKDSDTGGMGWLFHEVGERIAVDCFLSGPKDAVAVLVSRVFLDDVRRLASIGQSCGFISGIGLNAIKNGVLTEKEVKAWSLEFIYHCAALTHPHAATTERVVRSPKGGDAAQRAMFRRRMQRSGGMFSFNVVHFSVPNPAKSSSVVRETAALTPKRAHLRMGHWRLIEGRRSGSPYFVWVDACEAGNAELGRVVKERHVSIATSSVRRGFLVPAIQGKRGDVVPATKAGGGQ